MKTSCNCVGTRCIIYYLLDYCNLFVKDKGILKHKTTGNKERNVFLKYTLLNKLKKTENIHNGTHFSIDTRIYVRTQNVE